MERFLMLVLALFCVSATAQNTRIVVNRLEVKDTLKLRNVKVSSISTDATMASASDLVIPTQKAVKDYITSVVASGKITLRASKPSPLTTFITEAVVDTVGVDSFWIWNASIYRLLQTGGSGGGAPSGPAGGSLTGTYPDPTFAANTVGNTQVINKSLDSTDIKNRGLALLQLNGSGAANGQVPKFNSTTGNWEPGTVSGGTTTVDTTLVFSSGLLFKAANIYGTTRLVAGAEKALRVKRADGLEADFTFLRSGKMDANQLESFLNGQIGYVIKFYDQKGTNHAIQNNLAFAPTIANYSGIIRVDFHAAGLKNMRYSTSSALANNSSALFLVWNSSTASQFSNLSSSTAYIAKGTGFAVQFTNTTTPKLVLQVENGGTRSTTVFPVGHDNTLLVNNATANSTVKANERTSTITAGSGAAASSWSMGDSLNFWTGHVMAWVHFGDDLTTFEADTVQAIAKNNFALKTKSETQANLIFEGNSITNGSADPEFRGWTERVVGQGKTHKANLAVSGSVVADLVTRAPVVDSLYLPGKKNILVVWAGTNDIFNNSSTSGATYNALAAYITARKAKGYKVIALTCIARNGPGSTRDTARVNFNALLKASAIPDYVVDVAADTAFLWFTGYAGSTHYYRQYLSDGIHPTQEGHKRIASIVQPTVSAALSESAENPRKLGILNGIIGGNTIYANRIYGKNPSAYNSTLVIGSDESGNGTAEAGTLVLNPGPYNFIAIGYPSRQQAHFAYRHSSNLGGAYLSFVGGATGKDVSFMLGVDTRSFYSATAAFRLTTSDEFEVSTNGTGTLRRAGSTRLFWNSQGVGINTTTLSGGTELEVNGDINATTYRIGDTYRALNYGSGSPEGVVLGIAGSVYFRTDVGSDLLYVKSTGSVGSPTTTGWLLFRTATNLGYTTDAVTGTVTNSNGTAAVLPGATDLDAGLLSASDYVAIQASKLVRNGLLSGTTDGSGDLVITFSSALPNSTYSLNLTIEGTASMECTVISKTTTTATVRFFGSTTGLALASTSVSASYIAKDY